MLRILFLASISLSPISTVHAQDFAESGNRALIAKDVCYFFAKFAHATGNGEIEFQQGRFTVKGSNQSLTISEDSIPITSVPDFTYESYKSCLSQIINSFEGVNEDADFRSWLDSFDAGNEVSSILSIGGCMEPAAKAGIYFSNTLSSNQIPFDRDAFYKFAQSVEISATSRLERISDEGISLDLQSEMKFFGNFGQRELPYYEPSTIVRIWREIDSVLDADQRDFRQMGELVGMLETISNYIVPFSKISQILSSRNDPKSTFQLSHVGPTYQCLLYNYEDKKRRLEELFWELGGLVDVEIPNYTYILSESDHRRDVFRNEVTSKIREAIRKL